MAIISTFYATKGKKMGHEKYDIFNEYMPLARNKSKYRNRRAHRL